MGEGLSSVSIQSVSEDEDDDIDRNQGFAPRGWNLLLSLSPGNERRTRVDNLCKKYLITSFFINCSGASFIYSEEKKVEGEKKYRQRRLSAHHPRTFRSRRLSIDLPMREYKVLAMAVANARMSRQIPSVLSLQTWYVFFPPSHMSHHSGCF